MLFKIGDLVTRNSYDNDTVFKIVSIENDVCYLKGVEIRLYADSPLNDLKFVDSVNYESKEDEEFINRANEILKLDRNSFFYLPGKILHIDADHLCNSEFEKVL